MKKQPLFRINVVNLRFGKVCESLCVKLRVYNRIPPKSGDQPWDFFGRNDAEAETPVLWPPDAKS